MGVFSAEASCGSTRSPLACGPTGWPMTRNAGGFSWLMSAIQPFTARTPSRSSTSTAASGSPILRSPDARAGRSTIRWWAPSTSTSPTHRRSSSSGPTIRWPSVAWWRSPTPGPMDWTSMSSAAGSSARATRAYCSRWRPTRRDPQGRAHRRRARRCVLQPGAGRLYVAIGDPGVIEVFDTAPLRRHETIVTEAGAHTLSFDATRNIVCAFLPASHRAAVYQDRP